MAKTRWQCEQIAKLFDLPFLDLIFKAQSVHRQHFNANEIQLSRLLSIKTGACPEDCKYCPQSGHYNTQLDKEKLLPLEHILAAARLAKRQGATRFCMGAAWRSPPKKEFAKVLTTVRAVKALGLQTCVTLGKLEPEQAQALKQAGLDFYNHNLDTSPEYYKEIIYTRTYQDRLDTLQYVHDAGVKICCGGIIGMGESREDRVNFLLQIANLPEPLESIPINRLIAVKGTPLEGTPQIDNIEFIRTIAVARVLNPEANIRLSAGRVDMSDEMQTLCFMAGANSIFIGDVLLTEPNPTETDDFTLLNKLGIETEALC